jgi:hypothetical protein
VNGPFTRQSHLRQDGQDELFLRDAHGTVEYAHSDLVSAKKQPVKDNSRGLPHPPP